MEPSMLVIDHDNRKDPWLLMSWPESLDEPRFVGRFHTKEQAVAAAQNVVCPLVGKEIWQVDNIGNFQAWQVLEIAWEDGF